MSEKRQGIAGAELGARIGRRAWHSSVALAWRVAAVSTLVAATLGGLRG